MKVIKIKLFLKQRNVSCFFFHIISIRKNQKNERSYYTIISVVRVNIQIKSLFNKTNHFPGLGLPLFLLLFGLILLEFPKICVLEALESLRLSLEWFLFNSPSISSTSYLFFFVGPDSSGTTSPPCALHCLQAATASIIRSVMSMSKIMPIANRSIQQVASHADPDTQRLYKKQKITSPIRYSTLPATSYLKGNLRAKKAAQATNKNAAQQQKDVVAYCTAKTTKRANKAAFAQFANQSHFRNGSSVSSSKYLYRMTWTIGKITNTARTTMAGMEIVPLVSVIRLQSDKQIKGKQNHLNSPLNILKTRGKVTPFSRTFQGIVINLMISRHPTKMTKNERAKPLKHTQVPIGQQKPVRESEGSTIRLLPTYSLLEKGIETEALAIAKMYPHWMQSRALE